MKDTWFGISGIAMTLVLMALPCSVDCGSAGVTSCFSLTPIAQGNWFPALAVLFAVLALRFRAVEEGDLLGLPQGERLCGVLKKCKLLKR